MSQQLELPNLKYVTRLSLEGIIYTAQRRKCGKAECKCMTGDPQFLHGPYWYSRDTGSGAIAYVGRCLPPDVVRAWSVQMSRRSELQECIKAIEEEICSLTKRLVALAALESGQALDQNKRNQISYLGFGDCLVSFLSSTFSQD